MDKPFFTKGFICSHVLRECELFGEPYGEPYGELYGELYGIVSV